MMTEPTNNTESEKEEDEYEFDTMNSTTRLSVDMAGISLDVETDDIEECEALFNRTWDKVLNDAEEMSDALNERMNSM